MECLDVVRVCVSWVSPPVHQREGEGGGCFLTWQDTHPSIIKPFRLDTLHCAIHGYSVLLGVCGRLDLFLFAWQVLPCQNGSRGWLIRNSQQMATTEMLFRML